MKHWAEENKKDLSIATACVIAAGTITMCAVVCAKAVSVLFKLNKALDLYIKEHQLSHERNKRMENLYQECADEEEISF